MSVLTWPVFDGGPVEACVTTRHGGVSKGSFGSLNLAFHVGDDPVCVLENRRRAAAVMDASIEDLVVAEQIHGNEVAVVGEAHRGRGASGCAGAIAGVDALVTAVPGPVLVTLVADCAPVVLADPQARIIGCVHAGWRGTLGGVIEKTLDTMATLGASTDMVLAGVGPAIGAARFEVGEEVQRAAQSHVGDPGSLFRAGREGHFFFDLAGTVRALLVRAGVAEERIGVAEIDTGPPGPFFSARAEPGCGRFALLARIVP